MEERVTQMGCAVFLQTVDARDNFQQARDEFVFAVSNCFIVCRELRFQAWVRQKLLASLVRNLYLFEFYYIIANRLIDTCATGGWFMSGRFFALRLLSAAFKLLAIVNLIAMIGAIVIILIDATDFPTIDSKLPVIGGAAVAAIIGTVLLFGIGQLLDVLMAIEMNTRAMTKILQRTGKLMDERL